MTIIHALQSSLQKQTWEEIIAVITGLLCVYLAAKNNIWNWPFAILSVSIYIFIFYEARLFADMGLQFYLLAMNIYGWFYWSKKPAGDVKQPVIRLKKKEALLTALGVVLITIFLG